MNNSLIQLFATKLKPLFLIRNDGYKSLISVNVNFAKISCNNQFLASSSLINFEQVRHGRQFKRITGPPRPPLPFKEVPSPHFYEYRPIYPKVVVS